MAMSRVRAKMCIAFLEGYFQELFSNLNGNEMAG